MPGVVARLQELLGACGDVGVVVLVQPVTRAWRRRARCLQEVDGDAQVVFAMCVMA